MIEVVQAFDRTRITELAGDDPAALETKFEMARKLFSNRSAWLRPHQRIAILNRLANLVVDLLTTGGIVGRAVMKF